MITRPGPKGHSWLALDGAPYHFADGKLGWQRWWHLNQLRWQRVPGLCAQHLGHSFHGPVLKPWNHGQRLADTPRPVSVSHRRLTLQCFDLRWHQHLIRCHICSHGRGPFSRLFPQCMCAQSSRPDPSPTAKPSTQARTLHAHAQLGTVTPSQVNGPAPHPAGWEKPTSSLSPGLHRSEAAGWPAPLPSSAECPARFWEPGLGLSSSVHQLWFKPRRPQW